MGRQKTRKDKKRNKQIRSLIRIRMMKWTLMSCSSLTMRAKMKVKANSKCNDKEEEEDAEGEAKQRRQSQQERVVGDAGVVEDEQQNQAKEKRMPRIAMMTMMSQMRKRVNNRLSKKNRRRN